MSFAPVGLTPKIQMDNWVVQMKYLLKGTPHVHEELCRDALNVVMMDRTTDIVKTACQHYCIQVHKLHPSAPIFYNSRRVMFDGEGAMYFLNMPNHGPADAAVKDDRAPPKIKQ